MTQLATIKRILANEGQIDNFYCFENKLTLRLGARIHDLKGEGYEFEVEKDGKNTVYRVTKTPELKLF